MMNEDIYNKETILYATLGMITIELEYAYAYTYAMYTCMISIQHTCTDCILIEEVWYLHTRYLDDIYTLILLFAPLFAFTFISSII